MRKYTVKLYRTVGRVNKDMEVSFWDEDPARYLYGALVRGGEKAELRVESGDEVLATNYEAS
jgi:hypothetical protein